jgi:D-serine deaminase-like pyridoxal phosphate-dependent protein
MDRTGIVPGDNALELYRQIAASPGISAAGLHAYDGHIHDADLAARQEQFAQVNESLVGFRDKLLSSGLPVPNTIASGTPTFALHAQHTDRECSPGTYVFWDFGYQRYTDLDFQIAALLVTRVISKPSPNRLCVDLGHKSVAAENPQPRVQFLNLPNATPVMHSEEHLVIETPEAANWSVGDVLYGVPRHICPTVALHDFCYPVENGIAGDPWPIEARRRKITI